MAIAGNRKRTTPPGPSENPGSSKRSRQSRSANRYGPLETMAESDVTMASAQADQSTPSPTPLHPREPIPEADVFGTAASNAPAPPAPPPAPHTEAPQNPTSPPSGATPQGAQPLQPTPAAVTQTPLTPASTPLAHQPGPHVPHQPPGTEDPHVETDTTNLFAHLAVAAENRRRMNNPGTNPPSSLPVHTPVPRGGFPEVHLRHGSQLFENIDPTGITNWADRAGNKLLARVFEYNANTATPERTQTVLNALRVTVTGIANETKHDHALAAKIAPPPRAAEADANPEAFLIYDIAPNTFEILRRTKVWSTRSITFDIWPFHPSFPTFLFPLDGFATDDAAAVKEIIIHTWRSSVANTEISDAFAEDPDFPRTSPECRMDYIGGAFETLTSSLRVEHLDVRITGNVPTPRFNIYATIPTRFPKNWHKVRDILERQLYISSLNGTGYAGEIFVCQICHCVTHPKGLCPFPRVEGWLGPGKPTTTPPAPSSHQGRQSRNGGRRSHLRS